MWSYELIIVTLHRFIAIEQFYRGRRETPKLKKMMTPPHSNESYKISKKLAFHNSKGNLKS
jgi:hypothetical protein